ncbi:hypothetical protein GCM10009818_20940 [Nakamurella flavida]
MTRDPRPEPTPPRTARVCDAANDRPIPPRMAAFGAAATTAMLAMLIAPTPVAAAPCRAASAQAPGGETTRPSWSLTPNSTDPAVFELVSPYDCSTPTPDPSGTTTPAGPTPDDPTGPTTVPPTTTASATSSPSIGTTSAAAGSASAAPSVATSRGPRSPGGGTHDDTAAATPSRGGPLAWTGAGPLLAMVLTGAALLAAGAVLWTRGRRRLHR